MTSYRKQAANTFSLRARRGVLPYRPPAAPANTGRSRRLATAARSSLCLSRNLATWPPSVGPTVVFQLRVKDNFCTIFLHTFEIDFSIAVFSTTFCNRRVCPRYFLRELTQLRARVFFITIRGTRKNIYLCVGVFG